MSDHTQELMKKLEQRVNRRTFLKGSVLAGAAIIGIAALPALTFAQQPQDQPKADDKDAKKDDKSDQGADKKEQARGRRIQGHSQGQQRPRLSRLSAVRLQHVQAGSHVDVRELRLQLHRIDQHSMTTAVQLSRLPLVSAVVDERRGDILRIAVLPHQIRHARLVQHPVNRRRS